MNTLFSDRFAKALASAAASVTVLGLGGMSFADVALVSQSREVYTIATSNPQSRTAPDFDVFVNSVESIVGNAAARASQSSSISPTAFSYSGSGLAFGGPVQARSTYVVVFDVSSPQTFNVQAASASRDASLAPGTIRFRLFTDLATIFTREMFPLQPF